MRRACGRLLLPLPPRRPLATGTNATATAATCSLLTQPPAAPTTTTPPTHNRRRRAASPPRPSSSSPSPRLRVLDRRVGRLLNPRTPPADVVQLCADLAGATARTRHNHGPHDRSDEVALVARTDPRAWTLALQRRLGQADDAGARAVLDLVASFAPANAGEELWVDLLFSLLRQRRPSLSAPPAVRPLLARLRTTHGDDAVARILTAVINGCANLKMFDDACWLVGFVLDDLELTINAIPAPVLGNLMAQMRARRRFAAVAALAEDLHAHGAALQAQAWIAIIQSCAQLDTQGNGGGHLGRNIDRFLKSFRCGPRDPRVQYARVFGAMIQSCLVAQRPRLVLRCFEAMRGDRSHDDPEEDTRAWAVRPDENIYVNVLKASRELHDAGLFVDVYRLMARDGVARSAGFGSAVRFCHEHRDVPLLEEVLDEAFATERRLHGAWSLPIEQYNDALGCFAEARAFDHAQELFARVLAHPIVRPDRITMVEMVQNYRRAPFAEVFGLMELFLELGLAPDLPVFTSLLAACGRHRLISDAMALLDAMRAQGLRPDVPALTAVAFIYATHAHLAGLVGLLRELEERALRADQRFFDTLIDGLYGAHGIDLCFALVRETLDAGLAVPAGLYRALVRVGTSAGLIERTLHLAYNMECEGIRLDSGQLLALIRRCSAGTEVTELLRTFDLLHQGRQWPPAVATARVSGVDDQDDDEVEGEEEEEEEAYYSAQCYDELARLAGRCGQRDGVALVRRLARQIGYDLRDIDDDASASGLESRSSSSSSGSNWSAPSDAPAATSGAVGPTRLQ